MSDFEVVPAELKALGGRFITYDTQRIAEIEIGPEPVYDPTRDALATCANRTVTLDLLLRRTVIALGDGLEATAKAYRIADGWP